MSVFEELERLDPIPFLTEDGVYLYNGFPMLWMDENGEMVINTLKYNQYLLEVYGRYKQYLQEKLDNGNIEQIYKLHINRWNDIKNELHNRFNSIEEFSEWDRIFDISYDAHKKLHLQTIKECIAFLNRMCGKEVVKPIEKEPTLEDKLTTYFNKDIITTKELSELLEIDPKTLTKYCREGKLTALSYKEKNSSLYSIQEVVQFIKSSTKYSKIIGSKI